MLFRYLVFKKNNNLLFELGSSNKLIQDLINKYELKEIPKIK